MLPTITIDIGTTSIKLCAFDAESAAVASARVATPTIRDDGGEIYDVDALHAAIRAFIGDVDARTRSSIDRVAVTGVGESGALVRPDITLASPLILWHDQRGLPHLVDLDERARSRIYEVTGLPVSGNYGLSKVAWALAQAGSPKDVLWLNVAEYIAATMTGRRWAEPTLASRTMALDLVDRVWSSEASSLVGVDVGVFPPLRPAGEGVPISPGFAQQVGLRSDVQVHVAGHDHMVGGVGSGLKRGELLNSTGTTEGLLLLQAAPSLDTRAERAKLANGLACTGEDFTLFASIPTGGSAFATLQHLTGVDATDLVGRIDAVHHRYVAGGLDPRRAPLVLPRFRGAPPPTKDHSARGIVAGIRADTTLDELVFGCFLGMVRQFGDVLHLFGATPSRIKVIGPASSNSLWQQLKSDYLGVPLTASREPEVVSLGAQALASGEPRRWDAVNPLDIETSPERHALLREWSEDSEAQWAHLKGFPS